MALSDTITTLGNNIVTLIKTRANKDLSNLSATGNAKLGASSASLPVGTVIAYMGTDVPDGFLLMDGREVSKTTYADLYNVIGDTQGTATDSTKFCIADMTDGRYLMGSTVAGGSVSMSLPDILAGNGSINVTNGGGFNNNMTGAFYPTTSAGSPTTYDANKVTYKLNFKASRSNKIYSGKSVIPASRKVLFFIKF